MGIVGNLMTGNSIQTPCVALAVGEATKVVLVATTSTKTDMGIVRKEGFVT